MTPPLPALLLDGERRPVELAFMDCDGVIFDVNQPKARAFYDAVEGYPEACRHALDAYHRAHGGVSRYAKFSHFFSVIHPVDDVEAATAVALERFARGSEAAYGPETLRHEALKFADHIGAARVHVVSGADQQELRRIFARHGIADRFASIRGSPGKKVDAMAEILRQSDGARAVMVGDGRADHEAARQLAIPFVFLREMSLWRGADEHFGPETAVAETWAELCSWLS